MTLLRPPDFHGMCPPAFPFGGVPPGGALGSFTGDEKDPILFCSGQPEGAAERCEGPAFRMTLGRPGPCPTPHAVVVVVRSRTGQPAGAWPGSRNGQSWLLGSRAAGKEPRSSESHRPHSASELLFPEMRVSILEATELQFWRCCLGVSGQLYLGEGCWAFAPSVGPFCFPTPRHRWPDVPSTREAVGWAQGAKRQPTQC